MVEKRAVNHSWPTWLAILVVVLAIFNGLPFLAPVFMKIGWETPGRLIYFAYGFLCHQMAQRSFFLFGPASFQMYSMDTLPLKLSGLTEASRILALRGFIGNPQLGWKVAWSDRMVSMYGSPLFAASLYGLVRTRIHVRPITLWVFALLMVPMAIDGLTHMISDFAGIGQGFRDSNLWLAVLTGNALPKWFYSGDSLGSFNSWMRFFSGLSFGIAVAGVILPYVDDAAELNPYSPQPAPTQETV